MVVFNLWINLFKLFRFGFLIKFINLTLQLLKKYLKPVDPSYVLILIFFFLKKFFFKRPIKADSSEIKCSVSIISCFLTT